MPRKRLDQILVERHLAESREKAQRLIRSGAVRVNGQPATKPGHTYPGDCDLTLKEQPRFVGRGGEKLQAAFDHFKLVVEGMVCADIGSSTGGFTDCLLQHGASRVYAVDVGKGQLHQRLREDDRVVVMEGCNARNLEPDQMAPPPAFAAVDVSFISLRAILPALGRCLDHPAEVVTLIKPQFEAGREQVGKGGVVRDEIVRQSVVDELLDFGRDELNWKSMGVLPSPLKGPAGNVEFLAHWILP